MKTEIQWLENFKRNLEDMLSKEYETHRKKIIIWELDWINNRIEKISLKDEKAKEEKK